MVKTFASLEPALKFSMKGVYFTFIVAEEVDETFTDPDGQELHVSRRYHVFKDWKEYHVQMDVYDHCHEVIVPMSQTNDLMPTQGRIVFDFDLDGYRPHQVPDHFAPSMESLIKTLLDTKYKDLDTSKLGFVWMDCANPKKVSAHLVVTGVILWMNWVAQLKLIYHQCVHLIGESLKKGELEWAWIPDKDATKLIDMGLANKNATLRMPGNSKLGGQPLVFRNPNTPWTDGLVRPIVPTNYKNDQKILITSTDDDLTNYTRSRPMPMQQVAPTAEQILSTGSVNRVRELRSGDYEDAYRIFDTYNNKSRAFVMGMCVGPFIELIRKKSSNCIVSGKDHDRINAYLYIHPQTRDVYYGCRRECVTSTGAKFKLMSAPGKKVLFG